MITITRLFCATLCLATAVSALAEVHYVDINCTNATPPYASWTTAATNIQDAVNSAVAGDEIVVTNGTYATGGRAVYGTMTNRVAVDKPLDLRSVNGPEFTIIQGSPDPNTGTNGDGAIRCVYLTNGASLSGFTLTNGATHTGGDYVRETSGGGLLCESVGAVTVSNCVVTGNSAVTFGGGAYGGTLNNCTLGGNWSGSFGGGAEGCDLNGCTLTHNSAQQGGGAAGGTLNNCTLSGNSANGREGDGGGAYGSALNNCTLTGNSARGYYYWHGVVLIPAQGGGAAYCTLNNCTLSGNSAYAYGAYSGLGGGASSSTLNNCTLTRNSAGSGGGADQDTLNNCIVYFNVGGNYNYNCTLSYCCTTPLPPGPGNISDDPHLTDSAHLGANSPCVAAGSSAFSQGVDIDGEPWLTPASIGCDEFHAGPVTGPLAVSLAADYTNVVPGIALNFTGQINGHATVNLWDFDDGTFAINQHIGLPHSFATLGEYTVRLWAYNDSHPAGVSASLVIHVENGLRYVSAANPNPMAPYTSWATAATDIQTAVDAAPPGGTVLVTNGLYGQISVGKPLAVRSLNGAEDTTISGGWGRCVWLTNGASLWGFTLSGGRVQNENGGGAYGGTLNSCILVGNSAHSVCSSSSGGNGGGAAYCTLNNCTLSGNSVDLRFDNCFLPFPGQINFPNVGDFGDGGGAYYCTLNNCTLTQNSAINYFCFSYWNSYDFGHYGDGGGAAYCALRNCILSDNSAGERSGCDIDPWSDYGDYGRGGAAYRSSLLNCLVGWGDDLFLSGGGWWRTDPGFDSAQGGYRLQSNSPCINAGNNAFAPAGPDLDGNLRIAGGTVDIGAYEFQSPVSQISYAWLQQFNLPINPATDTADPDGDGVDNYHEWLASTHPTNSFSSPAQLTITPSGVPPSGIILTWSTNAVGFTLQSTTNLDSPIWSTNAPAPVVIAGQNTFTNPLTGPPQFYRLIH